MIDCFIIGDISTVSSVCNYVNEFLVTNLVGTLSEVPERLNDLLALKPDVVFVDADLAKENSTFLSRVRQFSTVVFISENKNGAYDAFEYLAFDCLIKPLSFDRFEKSINKLEHYRQLAQSRFPNKNGQDGFLIKVDSKGTKKVMVKCEDLLYVKALQNYVILHMVSGEQLTCYYTMKEMEHGLADLNFIRVHKSYLISTSKIISVEANSVWLGEQQATEIAIGNTYKNAFLERMNLRGIKKFIPENKMISFSKIAVLLVFFVEIAHDYCTFLSRLTI